LEAPKETGSAMIEANGLSKIKGVNQILLLAIEASRQVSVRSRSFEG